MDSGDNGSITNREKGEEDTDVISVLARILLVA